MGKATTRPQAVVQLSYQLLRNTTSPDENATGVKSFAGSYGSFLNKAGFAAMVVFVPLKEPLNPKLVLPPALTAPL